MHKYKHAPFGGLCLCVFFILGNVNRNQSKELQTNHRQRSLRSRVSVRFLARWVCARVACWRLVCEWVRVWVGECLGGWVVDGAGLEGGEKGDDS